MQITIGGEPYAVKEQPDDTDAWVYNPRGVKPQNVFTHYRRAQDDDATVFLAHDWTGAGKIIAAMCEGDRFTIEDNGITRQWHVVSIEVLSDVTPHSERVYAPDCVTFQTCARGNRDRIFVVCETD